MAERIAILNHRSGIMNQSQVQTFNCPVTFNSGLTQSPVSSVSGSLAFREMLQKVNSVSQPHEGTCTWILNLNEYQQWEKQRRGTFWLVGKPGSGKTTTMAFLYHRYEQMSKKHQQINLQFFFDAAGTDLQRSFLGLLRSLLSQLCSRDSETFRMMQDIYTSKCDTIGCPSTWLKEELIRNFEASIISCARRKRVSIFLDDIYVAGEEGGTEIITFFAGLEKGLPAAGGNASICISTRHYPIFIMTGLKVRIDQHNGHDIRSFIDDRLCLKSHVEQVAPEMKGLLRSLAVELADRAQGVFLWVHLVVPVIRKRVLEGQSQQELRDYLVQVPQGLQRTYQYIITNVIDVTYIDDAISLFKCFCMAETPLSLTQLQYAMSTHWAVDPLRSRRERVFENNRQLAARVFAWSGGLVEISPENSDFVQPIHSTVKAFLIKQGLDLLLSMRAARDNATQGEDKRRSRRSLPECLRRLKG